MNQPSGATHPLRSLGLLDALFPLACPGCGRPGAAVCLDCAAGARPAPEAAPPAGVDAWASPFAYEGVVREVVARSKYRNRRGAVPWLAPHLGAAAAQLLRDVASGDVVVTWAPTTRGRRRARGFDHAELLARATARQLRLPCRALLRRSDGPPQTGLPASRRLHAPRLSSTPRASSVLRSHGVALVVDDVATTGGTLAAAAAALRAAGAVRVLGLTAARTPAP